MKKSVVAASLALLIMAGTADAAVYTVNQTIGLGSVTGSLTTNGTIGALSASDFTAWDLLLTGAGGVTYSISQANSSVVAIGGSVTATNDNIFFNYSSGANDYLLFQDGLFTGMRYWCNASTSSDCLQGASVVPQSFNSPSAQFEARRGTIAIATVSAVPEPATWALMLAGFAMVGAAVRYRRRKLAVGYA